jgi:hypothetical protein
MKKPLMLSILTLAACTSGAPPSTIHTELRLRGVDAAGYRAVLLDIKDLRVVADGRTLEVMPAEVRLDLGDENRSLVIGTVDVPRGAQRVQVSVTLDDAGAFERKDEAGDIDIRGVPLEFTTTAAQLAQHARADMELDLGRSLHDRGPERRLLVPDLSVHY